MKARSGHQNFHSFQANKIYLNTGVTIQPAFVAITEKSFGPTTQVLDFSKNQEAAAIINDWIDAQTNHKIQYLVSADYLSAATRIVLVNAIYFLGNWKYQFDPRNTRKDNFYNSIDKTVKVDMMLMKNDFNYTKLPDFNATALRLDYKDSDISLMVILPNSVTGLPLIEEGLKVTAFEDIVKSMTKKSVTVYLPKFKIATEIDLGKTLEAVSQSASLICLFY